MMDLFSIFNPITSMSLSMNWLMLPMSMHILMTSAWKSTSNSMMINTMLLKTSSKQFKTSMNKLNKSNMIMVVSIMMLISILNLMSLMPNTFSTTSHLMINLSIALSMWSALLIKKTKNTMKMLSHLTPSGTPTILIPFMVIIELVSMLIQPITLSIRLTANITAGHIMMLLISQMYTISTVPALITNLMMMNLELGVALIQAYVFAMLIIMYSK